MKEDLKQAGKYLDTPVTWMALVKLGTIINVVVQPNIFAFTVMFLLFYFEIRDLAKEVYYKFKQTK